MASSRSEEKASKKSSPKLDQKQLLIFEAARLCYDFDLSQREVAETLGLSPATLTRFLKKAKDLGIIKFNVQPPDGYVKDIEVVTSQLRDRLGIKEVVITPSSSRPEIVRKEIGFAAAKWLLATAAYGMTIGFSGGRTVAALIPFLKKTQASLKIVQLMGGVTSTEEAIQADVTARAAAEQMDEACLVIHGPAVFPDAAALKAFLDNRIVTDVVEHFGRLDIAMVGIGAPSPDNPLIKSRLLTSEEIEGLTAKGYVGDICCHFFTANGKDCVPSLAKRVLGIQLEQLVKTPRVCVVAAGSEKIPAIVAVCKAGIAKTLVTDVQTAAEILKHGK